MAADDAWQLPQFERELARAAASSHEGELELRLSDVRALLQSRLAGRPTRANFRTGTLTVCTMVPMRSVPHRVVCLVGLDDGVFPRAGAVDGDDVLGRRPLTGERDPRSEDRQLLLDAVLAATEHLVITYTGANEQSGARRPPAVPLGEILDAADRTTAAPVRDQVLTRHPLQPYDARNFERARPFSFDTAALAGARSAWSVRHEPPPLLAGPLPPGPATDVSLQDLKAFLVHPVRAFLRERLDVSTPFEPDDLADAIPVTLDNLEKWQIGDHLLRELLAGQDPVAVMTAEQLRGTLPPGGLGTVGARRGRPRSARSSGPAPPTYARASAARSTWTSTSATAAGSPAPCPASTATGSSRSATPGSSARQRLQTWVDLLALSAVAPRRALDRATRSAASAPGRSAPCPGRSTTAPSTGCATWSTSATRACASRCRCRSPPAPPGPRRTSRELMGQDISPAEAARREWETDPHNQFGITGEDDDAYHRGSTAPALRSACCSTPGWRRYAWRIWEPLLTGAREGGSAVNAASTSATRCPPAPSCSRPAPAPARPGPSARW